VTRSSSIITVKQDNCRLAPRRDVRGFGGYIRSRIDTRAYKSAAFPVIIPFELSAERFHIGVDMKIPAIRRVERKGRCYRELRIAIDIRRP